MSRNLVILTLSLCAICAPVGAAVSMQEASAEGQPVLTPPPASASTLTLTAGQSRILRFPNIGRAAIGNPAVADIAVLSRTEILLNAKTPGETLLFVPNTKGEASITVRVTQVPTDTSAVEASINQGLSGTGVTASVVGGTVFLRGTVTTPEQEAQAVSVAKAFMPNVVSLIQVSQPSSAVVAQTLGDALKPLGVTVRPSGANVLILEGATTTENLETVNKIATQLASGFQVVNLVTDSVAGQQIVIHARVVDVDQQALRDLGIDWGRITVDSKDVPIGVDQPIVFGESGSIPDKLFGAGAIRRLNPLGAAIQALEQGNRAKVLSAPDVLVQNGHKAQIVVGGQIPVPVPQIGAGTATIVIDYKEYGVKLEVTPRILENGSVDMRVLPEVSTLDYANAVILNGFRIPAFLVRRADTQVTMASGQTLVIGGLLQDQDVDSMRKVPLLADIPILGELFKFRSRSRIRTQLVILVTPEVLAPGQAPAIPPLADIKTEEPRLKPILPGMGASSNEPPATPGVPAPGPTPIPMQEGNRMGAAPAATESAAKPA